MKKEEVKKPEPAPIKKEDVKKADFVPVKKEEVKKPDPASVKKDEIKKTDPVPAAKKEEVKVPPPVKKEDPAKALDTKPKVPVLPDPSKLPAASTKADPRTSSSLSTQGQIKAPVDTPISAPPKTETPATKKDMKIADPIAPKQEKKDTPLADAKK